MYSDSLYEDSIEEILEHHGILGMKWGIRRYQNPDGSLTPEGRKRYGVNTVAEYKAKKKKMRADRKQARINRKIQRQQAKIDKQKAANEKKLADFRKNPNKYLTDVKWIKKNQNLLSKQDIQNAIDRINTMNDLNNKYRDQLSQAKKYVDTLIAYGETANHVINFLNTDAGKMIRKAMGFDPNKRVGFGANKNDKINNPNQNQNQNQNQTQTNNRDDDGSVNINIINGRKTQQSETRTKPAQKTEKPVETTSPTAHKSASESTKTSRVQRGPKIKGSKYFRYANDQQSSIHEQTSSFMNYNSGYTQKQQSQVNDILNDMLPAVSNRRTNPTPNYLEWEYRDVLAYML